MRLVDRLSFVDMALFQPLQLGALTLKNRILMAPLTRCRATQDTHVPTELMVSHYAQRASAGLIIAEATMVAPKQSAFWTEPGIYSTEQIAGWKRVTDAVHAKGGLIALQIWHGGRACHPLNSGGEQPVAPSAIQITRHCPPDFNSTGEKVDYVEPRALTDDEIPSIIALFVQGAKNAIAAGFDAVEIHGANGYLIDEFWRSSSNQRTSGPYSGATVETRARFMLDTVKAVAAAIGKDRVGVRLSPLNSFNDQKDSDPIALLRYTLPQLNELGIAFVHMMRGDFFQAQTGDVITPTRELFKGVLITNMFYEVDEAEAAVAASQVDAVAFGTKFIANPDLPGRIRAKASLNPQRPEFFYSKGAEGYTDYPTLE